ncbi:MAG TPA: lytic murein transglycosylase [Methylomirabilota bacterium]|nr:lytic murein transglycosylase [Methylomirabilota bacterium]
MTSRTPHAASLALALLMAGSTAASAACQASGAGFDAWLAGFKQQAVTAGVAPAVVEAGLSGVTYDASVVKKDRGQGVFSQTFLEFAGRMVASYRMQHGANHIAKQANLFSRIEADYGVPAEVLVAIWGLESDFGANTGDMSTLRSLATLAFDCRRPHLFGPELVAALKIVQAGDLTPQAMRGAWAGELGQTQFLPTNYLIYGVDYDGDGRRDLIKSSADVLASTANFLARLGWQRGQPWLVEVTVPREMPWADAHLAEKKSADAWASLGVKARSGNIPPGNAALYLPMGRNGPAFLAYPNFDVYLGWNESLVYATTAAYFATRLAGAPKVSDGSGPVEVLRAPEIKAVQQALASRGIDPGPIDGKLGRLTREAVRTAQIQLSLPADGWPDTALLRALR